MWKRGVNWRRGFYQDYGVAGRRSLGGRALAYRVVNHGLNPQWNEPGLIVHIYSVCTPGTQEVEAGASVQGWVTDVAVVKE